MKVLFIYPNLFAQIGFNYGVASLSAVLKKENHTTALLNINEKMGYPLDFYRILNDIRAFSPDLIAFSIVTNQIQYALEIAQEIKKEFDIPIVCGGIHPTFAPEDILASGLFDAVFMGESENALRDYVESMAAGRDDLSTIRNLCYKQGSRIIKNPLYPFIPLESLPRKDYDIFDFQRMIDAKNGWVGLMTSRGCPFRCTYCFNHQMVKLYREGLVAPAAKLNYVRHHPIGDVIDEISFLLENYQNISMFIFDDDLFTFDRKYLYQFCKAYKKVSQVPFVVNAHVQVFDREMAGLLKDAGCQIVKFGIESGSDRVRREILQRPMKNEKIIEAFDFAHQEALHTSAFVMIGLPTETKEEVMETVSLLATVKPGRFRWSIFFPFPNTQAFEISKEAGLIDTTKMATLSNFTDDSCLDFGPEYNLWLRKVKAMFPWYVNARCQRSGASRYGELVAKYEALSEDSWDAIAPGIEALDQEEAAFQQAAGHLHYAIRFNPFMAVRSDWETDA